MRRPLPEGACPDLCATALAAAVIVLLGLLGLSTCVVVM